MRTKFDIVSARTVDDKENQKKYVVYDIKIYHQGSDNDTQAIFVERRYSDFLELFLNLRQNYPQLTTKISFPRKVLIGKFIFLFFFFSLTFTFTFFFKISRNKAQMNS